MKCDFSDILLFQTLCSKQYKIKIGIDLSTLGTQGPRGLCDFLKNLLLNALNLIQVCITQFQVLSAVQCSSKLNMKSISKLQVLPVHQVFKDFSHFCRPLLLQKSFKITKNCVSNSQLSLRNWISYFSIS
jgi:hypothetical protein